MAALGEATTIGARSRRTARRRGMVWLGLLAMLLTGVCIAIFGHAGSSAVVRTIPVDTLYPESGDVVTGEDSGRIFVSASDFAGHAHVLVIDPAGGAILRTIATPAWAGAQVVDRRSRHVFVASANRLFMLDARTGRVLRKTPIAPDPSSLSLDKQTERLYVGSFGSGSNRCVYGGVHNKCSVNDAALRVLDARTGGLLRTTIVHGQGEILASIDGHTHHLIVAGGASSPTLDAISVFDAWSGQLLRRNPIRNGYLAYASNSPVVDEATGRAFVPLSVDPFLSCGGGKISITGQRSSGVSGVAVVDTRSGKLVHIVSLGKGFVQVALDARAGRVFATTYGATCPILIRYPSNGTTGYFASVQAPAGAGSLHVLDARTGALLRSVPIGLATTALSVDARRGHIYVASAGTVDWTSGAFAGPGTLSVLDERTGQVLRTLAVGIDPTSLALDQRTGRLYVGNAGTYGVRHQSDPWAWVPGWIRRHLPLPSPPKPRTFRIPATVSVIDTGRL